MSHTSSRLKPFGLSFDHRGTTGGIQWIRGSKTSSRMDGGEAGAAKEGGHSVQEGSGRQSSSRPKQPGFGHNRSPGGSLGVGAEIPRGTRWVLCGAVFSSVRGAAGGAHHVIILAT